jgi:hypothetical protein
MNKPTFGTYRGWSDQWVYGAMLHGMGKAFIFECHDDVVNALGIDYIYPKYNQSLLDNIVEVDPKSLAMFTGLYDHEDTPIYGSIPLPDGTMSRGGDIVGGNFVRYSLECGKFVGQYYRPVLHDMFENLYELIADFDDYGAEYPVIGNAYEDPELLPEWEIEENKC